MQIITKIWNAWSCECLNMCDVIDSDIVNEVYNVSGGYEQTNNDVVKKLIGIFYNTDVNWKERVDYSAVNHRPGQDLRYSLDDSKIRKLGWLPDKVFDDELQF